MTNLAYFRGDTISVIRPEDEARFHPSINYNYYQQLNGYRWLKSLGIGYSLFQENYLTAIPEVLDTTKKILVPTPSEWKWLLRNSKLFKQPMPAKGRLSLYDVNIAPNNLPEII